MCENASNNSIIRSIGDIVAEFLVKEISGKKQKTMKEKKHKHKKSKTSRRRHSSSSRDSDASRSRYRSSSSRDSDSSGYRSTRHRYRSRSRSPEYRRNRPSRYSRRSSSSDNSDRHNKHRKSHKRYSSSSSGSSRSNERRSSKSEKRYSSGRSEDRSQYRSRSNYDYKEKTDKKNDSTDSNKSFGRTGSSTSKSELKGIIEDEKNTCIGTKESNNMNEIKSEKLEEVQVYGCALPEEMVCTTDAIKNDVKKENENELHDQKETLQSESVSSSTFKESTTSFTDQHNLSLAPPFPKLSDSCTPETKDETDNKLKQKLSALKREEILEKPMKEEEPSKEVSVTRHKKERKRSHSGDRYEGSAHKHSSKRSDSRDRDSRSKDKYRSKYQDQSRSQEKTEDKKRKSYRKNSKERPSTPEKALDPKIDKKKLLEVARKNMMTMLEKGTLPEGIEVEIIKKEQAAINSEKSVKELTDFCKALSERTDESVAVSAGGEENEGTTSESGQPFLHHPFKVKESTVIKVNIKNSVQLPVKSHAEKVTENARTLSLQFPVSSGDQHRQKELEWVPVVKDDKPAVVPAVKMEAVSPVNNEQTNIVSVPAPVEPLLPPPPIPVELAPPPPPPMLPPPPPPNLLSSFSQDFSQSQPPMDVPVYQPMIQQPIIEEQPMIQQSMMQQPIMQQPMMQQSVIQQPVVVEQPTFSSAAPVFPSPVEIPYQPMPIRKFNKPINISAIVAKRLKAMQKLQTDPNDMGAMNDLQDVEAELQAWVHSQQVPGQFTGSTNAKILTVQELCGPNPVWARKDVFLRAAPVVEGKGLSLLKKMGWNPGEGLGKHKEGQLEPLYLNIKMDKKGLICDDDRGKNGKPLHGVETDNKHPVSILMELCSKRRWPQPSYTEVVAAGPSHRKTFLFRVTVNGKNYQPASSRMNKKMAKAEAAMVCLQAVGVLSADYKLPGNSGT